MEPQARGSAKNEPHSDRDRIFVVVVVGGSIESRGACFWVRLALIRSVSHPSKIVPINTVEIEQNCERGFVGEARATPVIEWWQAFAQRMKNDAF